jgi:transcriptional regulator with GAF, ATPase, and Fis domain
MNELEELRRRNRDLEAIIALTTELLQLDDYDAMLDVLVRHALAILRAERGFLALTRGRSLELKLVRNWSRDELESGREPVSRSILKEVLSQRKPVLVQDALSDPRFERQRSVRLHGIRSVLAAPLEAEGRLAGALYLETSVMKDLFGPPELELFTRLLGIGARALETGLRRLLLEQRASVLEKELLARYDFQGIVTQDPSVVQLLQTVAQVAVSELPVLVQGPSGSGKELIVRALHLNSPRARRPLLTVNCGAISPQLLESELFGHVRGAFTGATADKTGLIPAAHTGTLFLDEVSELPKELQVKLLRTLQFGEVQPVGSSRTQTVDVRFLAATNRDLEREVKEGRFREDLFYRLNAITLHVPPLRERPDDILLLFHHFLRCAAEKLDQPPPVISSQLERMLLQHEWPGNVRELENEARRLVATNPAGLPLTADRLSPRLRQAVASEPSAPANLEAHERELVELHLRLAKGNRTHAAQSLGISRETLRQKLKRYGLA